MTIDRWQQLQELFNSASLMDSSERRVYLDKNCGDDLDLRRELEDLLQHADAENQQLDQPSQNNIVAMLQQRAAKDETAGSVVGPYRIVKRIGRGGFADVYLAVRESEFAQKVAIKILQPNHIEHESVLRRFELERQVLADLQHDGIARLIDGGTTADGRPYLIIEYVSGQTITEYCLANRCDLTQRLHLFQQLCAAVAYAHQFGVIHRDIKPPNILINVDGVVKLVDFGIAKLTDLRSRAEMLTLTQQGLLPFTPEYASPEQVNGNPVGLASDVYSLGVVLFELITGERPYEYQTHSPQEIVNAVCETTPLRPSNVVRQRLADLNRRASDPLEDDCAADRSPHHKNRYPLERSALRHHRRLLAGDLDNIVLKALRKEPERRYRSAAELHEDIQCYLSGMPVAAGGDSIRYRVKKFVQRNRVGAGAAMLVMLSVVVGFVTTSVAWRRARWALEQYQEQLHVSDSQLAFDAVQSGQLEQAQRVTSRLLSRASLTRAQPIELRLLQSLTHRPEPLVGRAHRAKVTELANVPGKPWVVSVGEDAMIHVWHAETGEHLSQMGPAAGPLQSVAISSDGTAVATGCKTVELWDLSTGQLQRTLKQHKSNVESLAFAPNRPELAIGVRYEDLSIVPLNRGKPYVLDKSNRNRYERLAYLPGGRSLIFPAFEAGQPVLRRCDCESKRISYELCAGSLKHMAISHDGRWVVATSADNPHIYVYDAFTGLCVHRIPRRSDSIVALTFSPDDSLVAGACDDGVVVMWRFIVTATEKTTSSALEFAPTTDASIAESVTLSRYDTFRAESRRLRTLLFADNQRLVTGGDEGTVKIWSTSGRQEVIRMGEKGNNIYQASLVSSQKILAAATGKDGVSLYNGQSGAYQWELKDSLDFDTGILSLSPNGNLVAIANGDGQIDLVTLDGQQKVGSLRHCDGFAVRCIDFSDDGKFLASTANDRTTCLWSVDERRLIHRWRHPKQCVYVRFNPMGTHLALGSVFRETQIIDVAERRVTERITVNSDTLSLAWSPNGRYLATGQNNGNIVLFDTWKRTSVHARREHLSICCLEFSPDNATLLTGESNGVIGLWHVATLRSMGVLHGAAQNASAVTGLFFTSNPDQLIATLWHDEGHPILAWPLESN